MKGFIVVCIIAVVVAAILYVFQRATRGTRWALLIELILSLFI